MISVLSYGGGVQSTALLVLACQGELAIDAAVFANVGDDSEDPRTLEYLAEHALPYAAEHGVRVDTVQLTRRDGSTPSLYSTVVAPNKRGYLIPVRLSGGHPGRRSCTADWKLAPIGKWLKANGATAADPATVNIGISTDEWMRAGRGKDHPYERRAYPLLDRGLSRQDCINIVTGVGLPQPPKSSCWFCPYHSIRNWREMRRDRPELFARAAEMEAILNAKLVARHRDPVWFTDRGGPLADVIAAADPSLFAEYDPSGECDSGACFT